MRENVNPSVRFSNWTGAVVEKKEATIGNRPGDQIRDEFKGRWLERKEGKAIGLRMDGEHQVAVGRNPRAITPAITFGIFVNFAFNGQNWFASAIGKRTAFPNYEIFARVDDHPWVNIFQYDHEAAGTGPLDITKHENFSGKQIKLP